MQISDFKPEAKWAYRESRKLGTEASPVELLLLVNRGRRKQVKVRHLEGELAGLEEFVHPSRLVCEWSNWPQRRRNEERESDLADYVRRRPIEPVIKAAAEGVLDATGEEVWLGNHGYSEIDRGTLDRIAARAGLDGRPWETPPAYKIDRDRWMVPASHLVDLALSFAAAEPETVSLFLEAQEETLRAEGFIPGRRFSHEYLISKKPAWAVAREWAGKDAERDVLRSEVRRLQMLVRDAARLLAESGHEQEAQRILRALEQG